MNGVFGSRLFCVALLALPLRFIGQPASLDSSFNPLLNAGAQVYALALQTNGQILVGGIFNSIGGVNVTNIAKLNVFDTVRVAGRKFDTTQRVYNESIFHLGFFEYRPPAN